MNEHRMKEEERGRVRSSVIVVYLAVVANVRMYKECVLARDILFARHRCQVRRRYHRDAHQDTFDMDSDPKHGEKG